MVLSLTSLFEGLQLDLKKKKKERQKSSRSRRGSAVPLRTQLVDFNGGRTSPGSASSPGAQAGRCPDPAAGGGLGADLAGVSWPFLCLVN